MTTITNNAVTIGKSNFSDLSSRLGSNLTNLGTGILRYGLVGILLFFGAFKFTQVEAQAIQPLVSNSPLMSWMYSVMSVQAVSNVIGSTEILVAVLMALRAFSLKLSAIGSLGAVCMTLTTLSFLFSTPGAWSSVEGFPLPVPAAVGGFLIKDLFLLGAAVLTAGEALLNVSPRQTSRG
jgi:reactive chlorine resistance protein C